MIQPVQKKRQEKIDNKKIEDGEVIRVQNIYKELCGAEVSDKTAFKNEGVRAVDNKTR